MPPTPVTIAVPNDLGSLRVSGRVERRSRPRKPRILIVDDDRDSCNILSEILSFLGYDCTCETDSTRAIPTILHNRFEGIVVDLVMPGASGFDMLRAIKASPYNDTIPVVASSAFSEFQYRALDAGFDAFLKKPTEISEVRQIVGELVPVPEGI